MEQAKNIFFFTVNGSIRIKLRENGPYNITHIDDLKDQIKSNIYPLYNFTFAVKILHKDGVSVYIV